jgi:hypothetical protein
MLKAWRHPRREGSWWARAAIAVLLVGTVASVALAIFRPSALVLFHPFVDYPAEHAKAPSRPTIGAAAKSVSTGGGRPTTPDILPEIGLAVLAVLIAAVLVKLGYQRLTKLTDEASIDRKKLVLRYEFIAPLPRQVALSWQYKNRSRYLTPLIEWDDERFVKNPGEEVQVTAARNVRHAASLVLTDAATVNAVHAVAFVVSVRLWRFPARVKTLELEFDSRIPSEQAEKIGPPVESAPLFPTGPQLEPGELDQAPANNSQIGLGRYGEPEAAMIAIANEFIGGALVDHSVLRRRLAESGLEIAIYSAFRVQDSANCVFTRHWFRPDEHAGAWLWFEDRGQYLAVPFDRSQLKAETMRHFLASMYEGVGARFAQQADATIESACRLARAREDDEYQVVRQGRFSTTDGRSVSQQLTARIWTEHAATSPSRLDDNEPVQAGDLLARVEALEGQFVRFEARSQAEGMTDEVEDLRRALRDISQRIERQLAVSAGFDARLARLEGKPVAPVAAAVDTQLPISEGDLASHQPSIPAAEPAADERPADMTEDRIPDSWAISAPRVSATPQLPSWWKTTLVRVRAIDHAAGDYLSILKLSLSRLAKIASASAQDVQTIHLVENDKEGIYDAHMNDEIVVDGTLLVGRCMEKPDARVPSCQFFIGWREPVSESLWIVCPPSKYPAIGFSYSTLIRDAPRGEFVIESVKTPARLDPTPDHRYKITTQMEVTFG